MDDRSSYFKKFKKSVWRISGTNCQQGLKTLKFHVLDNMVDELDVFGIVLLFRDSM